MAAQVGRPFQTGAPPVFVAIDLGTTMSGYAFCVGRATTEYNIQPDLEKKAKEPTVLLLKAGTGELVSFGRPAWGEYSVKEEQDKKNYLLFDRFKMTLFNDEVSEVLVCSAMLPKR